MSTVFTYTINHTSIMFFNDIFSACFHKNTISDICERGDYREFRKCKISSFNEIVEKDKSGRIPVLCAVNCRSIPIVKRMKKYGEIGKFRTIHGWSILHEAVLSGSFEMVLYILEECHTKPYMKTSDGFTSIHVAVRSGRCDILNVLLQYTPYNLVSSKNIDGITPLILAIMCKNVEMVNMIHRAGGSLLRETYNGLPVMFLAKQYGLSDKTCIPRKYVHYISNCPVSDNIPIMY